LADEAVAVTPSLPDEVSHVDDGTNVAAQPSITAPGPDAVRPLPSAAPRSSEPAPVLPLVSPVLSSPWAAPTATAVQADSAPDHPAEPHIDPAGDSPDADAEPEHPMAHLMPAKSKPTEASRKAAELRAAQKKRSRKIRNRVIVGLVAFTAIVGPPLGMWVVDAVNEAGSTGSDDAGE
jgi:hypothetical protein